MIKQLNRIADDDMQYLSNSCEIRVWGEIEILFHKNNEFNDTSNNEETVILLQNEHRGRCAS